MNLCQTDLIRVVVVVLLAKCVTPCNRGGVVKKEQSGKGHHILLLQPAGVVAASLLAGTMALITLDSCQLSLLPKN